MGSRPAKEGADRNRITGEPKEGGHFGNSFEEKRRENNARRQRSQSLQEQNL